MTPNEYAQAVRDALADLPPADLEELVEDLDDHLAEVAAESGVPLEERLGSPEVYAAELRVAYGARGAEGGSEAQVGLRTRAQARMVGLHGRMTRFAPYRQAVGFLPELRPAWWVLRGYAIGLLLVSFSTGSVQYVPESIGAWLFTLAAIWVSVWVGRRPRGARLRRVGLAGVNVLAGLVVLVGMVQIAEWNHDAGPVAGVSAVKLTEGAGFWNGVYNIFPYAKDGTPLTGVRLYDQEGRPITLDPEMYGYQIDRSCLEGMPADTYPLPLTPRSHLWPLDENGYPVPGRPQPTPCPSPSPSPSPTLSPSPSPAKPSPSKS
ncbi:DUF1700 domain-containing protein [Acrocarpospora catenulata]|uniref:DUF1700 domain-containing protein n=1 Tax=Acrocarpospora catenulata TaxID=2836182 RepID=UPI001BDB3270|nr:DUF1700 domain-containing protein [Acrocarpospora catenulata]